MSHILLIKIRDTKDNKEYTNFYNFEKEEELVSKMEDTKKIVSDLALASFVFQTEENEIILIPRIKLRKDCIITFYTGK